MPLNMEHTQQMKQQMQLTPQMLQSLSVMTMPAAELRDYLYEQAEKNPALEIQADRFEDGALSVAAAPRRTEQTERSVSAPAADEQSSLFQSFIESRPAPEPSLQDSLLAQLALLPLDAAHNSLCTRIIQNLDARGFHAAAPQELLRGGETPALLDECLRTVQSLDPSGIGVSDTQESLKVQAARTGNTSPLVSFFLDGHLDLLSYPKTAAVRRQLARLDPELAGTSSDADIESARQFIQSLDPYPARQFGNTVQYIAPDVRVERLPAADEADVQNEETWENGEPKMPVVYSAAHEAFRYVVLPVQGALPEIAVAPDFVSFLQDTRKDENSAEQRRALKQSVMQAQAVVSAVEQRTQTITRIAQAIADRQQQFFEKGPLYLAPLTQQEIADMAGVHETTVSRAVNGKWLSCSRGVFELKYFFSSRIAVCRPAAEAANSTDAAVPAAADARGLSKESVKLILKQIIEEYEHGNHGKPLSDARLADMLERRGVKIARRTVAKYRAELQIDSSFKR